VAKPELGTKRICPVTGRKFYDLNKDPVISPYTGEIVPIAPVVRGRPAVVAAAAPAVAPEAEPAEAESAEFVTLEEADAEAQGKAKEPVVEVAEGEEVEVAEDDTMDDAAFIEEQEEGDADVTDIIGEGIEKEEET
jgi:uncharacterized protein (TIGR02300 family)